MKRNVLIFWCIVLSACAVYGALYFVGRRTMPGHVCFMIAYRPILYFRAWHPEERTKGVRAGTLRMDGGRWNPIKPALQVRRETVGHFYEWLYWPDENLPWHDIRDLWEQRMSPIEISWERRMIYNPHCDDYRWQATITGIEFLSDDRALQVEAVKRNGDSQQPDGAVTQESAPSADP